MNEGDIVLTPLPQADGRMKNRPAIVLRRMPPFNDLLVCGVSSQLHQLAAELDEILSPDDADYSSSGLKSASLIRLGYLAVLPASQFIGTIGSISSARHRRLPDRLAMYIRTNI